MSAKAPHMRWRLFMNKIVAWIQTHKGRTACIVFIAFICPLVIVHILFKLKTNIDWLVAEWEPGDVLAYIAGFEALLGTVILGVITVKQSQDAQKMNERLSKENNYLQKISVQKLLPFIKIPKVVVEDSQEIKAQYVAPNSVSVSETITPNERRTFINIGTTSVGADEIFLKTIKLTLKNISEGIISKITIEKVEFPHFNLCGEYVPTTVCVGTEKHNTMSDLLLPDQEIDVLVKIHFDDKRLRRFWEFHESNSIGVFEMCIYLKNTSITGIDYKEKIAINQGYGFKEKVMYKAYGEDEENAG